MIFYPHAVLAIPIGHRLRHLGGVGLLLLGIADNSLVPLTGSMDVFTIWLAARHVEPWPYYALMATAGAVLGGYITYGLAREGGKEAMHRKLSQQSAARVSQAFERWGFGAVALPALMPPPFPFVPFLLAAGATQYPRKRFLAALIVGRGVRYTILSALGFIYGGHVLRFFRQYYAPALGILIGLAVVGAIVTIFQYLRHRRRHSSVRAS
ncbi:MAG TPA: VTT domain-containing protein [Candidatus Aquilonibacter sp.]|nr:VTT domain-containing protein [Candidatus Aquilonibacter sp.]